MTNALIDETNRCVFRIGEISVILGNLRNQVKALEEEEQRLIAKVISNKKEIDAAAKEMPRVSGYNGSR